MTDWTEFETKLGTITCITEPPLVKQKSRDFYWYSPVLKRELRGTSADIVVMPKNEAEIIDVIRLCYAENVPVTLRGGGSGNYGQAMPLKGGVLLDVSRLTRIKDISLGRVRAETGIRLIDLDAACQADSGQELRFHPSTRRIGTLGGFVAGGSGGVGSAAWGGLRDPGNILGVRVITVEAEPRILELRGDDIQKVNHAYGTNGIITEIEMPLAPAYKWIEVIVGFAGVMEAARFGQAIGQHDGIVKKLNTVLAAPIAQDYFKPLKNLLPAGQSFAFMMIAEQSMDALESVARDSAGKIIFRRETSMEAGQEIPPIYEFTWNHTTLHALKVEKTITYMQTLFPAPNNLELVAKMDTKFGDEVLTHLEFVRFDGEVTCFGLQLVRYSSDERLVEIMDELEANGCPVFNPHAYTLEEGGMKMIDHAQLAFKREADPQGLLNPGKMIAWDQPDWQGRTAIVHLFPAAGGST